MTIFTRARRGGWALAIAAGAVVLALALLQAGRAVGSSASASAGKAVTIKGFAFKPGTLRVAKGSRVAFSNDSGVTHTATRGGAFDKRLAPGATAFVRFKQKGTFAYHCTIHPFMRGKIVVE